MERAVLEAHGWTDIAVPPYCLRTNAESAAVAFSVTTATADLVDA